MNTWYEKGVFYHLYPLGLTGAPRQNEEPSVVNRFDELNQWILHIQKLGCNAVYIGPLFESSTHGYDTRDFKLIDRRLGSNESFRNFTRLCHEAGIKVVVDGVFNHTGREFFAFKDIQEKREVSPYKDWYKNVNFGGNSPAGDSFHYEAWQGHYGLPCLNLLNPEVKQYIFDVIRFWIDKFDIDGIRLDCANVLDFTFMKELRSQTTNMKDDFWLMGEVIHGDYSRWANDEMLHSVTNYELHKSLYSGHNDHNYFEIAHSVRRLESISPRLYTFVDNHDEDRIAGKLKDKNHLFPVYLLLFTLPGMPSVYYGSEWALEARRTNTCDYDLRPCISMADEPKLHCELTDFISKIAHIHTEYPEFYCGRYKELLLTNRQYAFARITDGENGACTAIITAVNNDDQPASLLIPIPVPGKRAVNLLDHTEYPIRENKIEVQIKGNYGIVLQIMED